MMWHLQYLYLLQTSLWDLCSCIRGVLPCTSPLSALALCSRGCSSLHRCFQVAPCQHAAFPSQTTCNFHLSILTLKTVDYDLWRYCVIFCDFPVYRQHSMCISIPGTMGSPVLYIGKTSVSSFSIPLSIFVLPFTTLLERRMCSFYWPEGWV